jgi:hypothetical protein
MPELLRFVNPDRSAELFGVQLIGVNAETGAKLLIRPALRSLCNESSPPSPGPSPSMPIGSAQRAFFSKRPAIILKIALAAVATIAALSGASGCASRSVLSEDMAAINREYAQLQDQAFLHNVLRRSAGLPAHYTSLTQIRGSNRFSAGASLTLPFGGDASPIFQLSPDMSWRGGPDFEVSTQANKKFFRGYLSPVALTTVHSYLRQDQVAELVLSLMVEQITLKQSDGGERNLFNSPDQPSNYSEFQEGLEQLVDQGLTTEEVQLAESGGPDFVAGDRLSLEQILAVKEKGFTLEEVEDGKAESRTRKPLYRLKRISPSVRFCFRNPDHSPFSEAPCRGGLLTNNRQFAPGDRHYFGTFGTATATLDAKAAGQLVLHLRSIAEMMDFLGEVAKVQLGGAPAPTIRTPAGRKPIFVVLKTTGDFEDGLSVTVSFNGARYAVPAGVAGGESGAVMTIISQLLAQAQSVRDLPASNTFTIWGD